MSADNTVIVLCTKSNKGTGVEYRVAHVQAMENLYYEADYPSKDNPIVNRAWMLAIFKGTRVFMDADAAFEEAFRMREQVGYVEYDVRAIDFSSIFFPASDRKRRQRRFVRHTHQQAQAY